MVEKYFVMPGCSIGKRGLPAGKLEVRKDGKPLEIKPELVKVLSKNIPYLLSTGKVVTANDLETKKESRSKKKKPAPELNLEIPETGDGE